MTAHAAAAARLPDARRLLNKVPEVTLFFWVIKIMCTTIGETAADYLNENLGTCSWPRSSCSSRTSP